jgi:signal transduction histidine kinase
MEDLSLHILDIVENSLSAGASWIKISLVEDTRKDLLLLEIQDNGKGMDAAMQGQALDPFYTTRSTRRVGLGLPLLAQAAQQCEGRLDIRSEPGQGTSVKALFRLSHPDLKPLGDISETLRTLLVGRPDLDLHFEYRQDDECIAQLGD